MGAAINFSDQVFQHGMCTNSMKMMQKGVRIRRTNANMVFNKWGFSQVMVSNRNKSSLRSKSHNSASDTVREFYQCINDNNLKELSHYIAEDCYFEDYAFPLPFKGRKDIMHFFEQLTAGMGPNVKFNIKHVCEGYELNASTNWHLEWKKTSIPFTRGCSFFECSKEGERLVIKKAQVMVESPIKPGGTVLCMLKILILLFDNFPKTAECMSNFDFQHFKSLNEKILACVMLDSNEMNPAQRNIICTGIKQEFLRVEICILIKCTFGRGPKASTCYSTLVSQGLRSAFGPFSQRLHQALEFDC